MSAIASFLWHCRSIEPFGDAGKFGLHLGLTMNEYVSREYIEEKIFSAGDKPCLISNMKVAVNLQGLQAVSANFINCDLSNCDFSGADLTQVSFDQCQFVGAIFDLQTNLEGTRLTMCVGLNELFCSDDIQSLIFDVVSFPEHYVDKLRDVFIQARAWAARLQKLDKLAQLEVLLEGGLTSRQLGE
jgi:Pentapeptide repeats (8 copies)